MSFERPHIPDRMTAREMLNRATSPVVKALARKAHLQAAVLDFDGTNWPFDGEPPMSVGIFRVLPTTSLRDWASKSGALQLKANETYLDYHMPKADNLSNATADIGYTAIAEYMRSRPEITHLVGVTYRAMALNARRNQDFTTEEIDLPRPVMNFAAATWQAMMPHAKPRHFTTAHLVWHTRDSLIERFGKRTSSDQ